jgi:cell division protein FtsB
VITQVAAEGVIELIGDQLPHQRCFGGKTDARIAVIIAELADLIVLQRFERLLARAQPLHAQQPMSPRVLGGTAVVLLAAGVAGYAGNQILRVTQMRREIVTMEREITTLRARTEELTRTVDGLRNDPAYVEKLAREEFGMVRPDETVLKFPSAAR